MLDKTRAIERYFEEGKHLNVLHTGVIAGVYISYMHFIELPERERVATVLDNCLRCKGKLQVIMVSIFMY